MISLVSARLASMAHSPKPKRSCQAHIFKGSLNWPRGPMGAIKGVNSNKMPSLSPTTHISLFENSKEAA